MEAKEAQNAEVIFGDPLLRFADEAHAACRDIVTAADVIEHFPVSRYRQSIDREIAPLGIGAPVAPEFHPRLAAERFHVLAKRRDFERTGVDDDGDGAVLDAGRHRLPAGCLDAAYDFVRLCRGRDVDLGDRQMKEFVPHRAANDARLFTAAVEQCKQPGDFILL